MVDPGLVDDPDLMRQAQAAFRDDDMDDMDDALAQVWPSLEVNWLPSMDPKVRSLLLDRLSADEHSLLMEGFPVLQGASLLAKGGSFCQTPQPATSNLQLLKDWPSDICSTERMFLAAPSIASRRTNACSGAGSGSAKPVPVPDQDGVYLWLRYSKRCYTAPAHTYSCTCAYQGHKVTTIHEYCVTYNKEKVCKLKMSAADKKKWHTVTFNSEERYQKRYKEWAGQTAFRPTWIPTLIVERQQQQQQQQQQQATSGDTTPQTMSTSNQSNAASSGKSTAGSIKRGSPPAPLPATKRQRAAAGPSLPQEQEPPMVLQPISAPAGNELLVQQPAAAAGAVVPHATRHITGSNQTVTNALMAMANAGAGVPTVHTAANQLLHTMLLLQQYTEHSSYGCSRTATGHAALPQLAAPQQNVAISMEGLQPSPMCAHSPVASTTGTAAAGVSVIIPASTQAPGHNEVDTSTAAPLGSKAAEGGTSVRLDELLCSLTAPPSYNLQLLRLRRAVTNRSMQAFKEVLWPVPSLDLLEQLQHQDASKRSVLHLLVTPTHMWDMDYYETGGSVEGDTGQVEYEMLKWLLGAMKKDELHTLLLRTNNKSLSAPLHTASRHAAQRPCGHAMMELLLQHCSMHHLAQSTSHGYLPPETAARNGDLESIKLYMEYALKQVQQAGLKPTQLQVLVFAPKDKYFQASGAVEVLKEACTQYPFLQPPSPPGERTQQEHLAATFQLAAEVTSRMSRLSCSVH